MLMEEVIAYLGLGSNIGDRLSNMRAAVEYIRNYRGCCIVDVSALYETKAVGVIEQPDFLNAVISIRTILTPKDLLEMCRSIENELGRKRTIRWGPRVIDVDILVYDNLMIKTDELTIPHPEMTSRAFVMVPLAEIAPDLLVDGEIVSSEAVEKLDISGVREFCSKDWSV